MAEDYGYKAIVITVDAPVLGRREGDERSKFSLPDTMKLEILESQSDFKVKGTEGSGLLKLFADKI
jgi:hypothetical protein